MEKIIELNCWMCNRTFAIKIDCTEKLLKEAEKGARKKLFYEMKEYQQKCYK